TDVSTSSPTDVATTSGITPSGSVSGTGIETSTSLPTGTDVTTSSALTETVVTSSIPTASATGISSNPTAITSTLSPSSEPTIPVSESKTTSESASTGAAEASNTTSAEPVEMTSTPTPSSAKETTPVVTAPPSSKPTPPQSFVPITTDDATNLVQPSSIVAQTTLSSASQSAMPSGVAPWIQPPDGMPTAVPEDMFLGQIAFDYGLNYNFVASNGTSGQIFVYLKQAIAQAIEVDVDDVVNYGLRAADTTQYKGWVTTLAVFMIPKDKNTTLETQLGQPASKFYHNVDADGNPHEVVNQLTSLVDPTWPLPYGKLPDGTGAPATNQNNPSDLNPSDVTGHGGALPGDTTGSRKFNATGAKIAVGAVVGAIAYGAAMFLVARRYRNKRAAHRRSSSVPSTSRYTYGSVGGGNWMSGARNGRLTPIAPGSRGSRGSSSSNGRSIRTQQISAPVMAENSLGWN
ncbi:hypothetical protein BU23DRAFT_444673, partial [Bimuria novae-zelandiae CBS 107.79]